MAQEIKFLRQQKKKKKKKKKLPPKLKFLINKKKKKKKKKNEKNFIIRVLFSLKLSNRTVKRVICLIDLQKY